MEKGYLGLEIGEKNLRFVYVTKHMGSLALLRAGELEVNLNFNTPGALTQAIRMVIEKEEILPKRVFVSLSRKDILIHQQLMPRMNAAELAQVVPGEIEKIPFFYNQSFEYAYTAFMHSKEKDRILLVAVSQEFLKAVIDEIDNVKLPFRDIEISPLNLKDLLPKPKAAERCEAILVVQELCSYFCIFKGNSYLGVYRSPVGSQQIMSPVNAANQEQMLANWVAEFSRVCKSHLVDNPQNPVEHLWVVADKTLCFQLGNELNKQLDLTTEIVGADKISNLKVPDNVEWDPLYASALTPILLSLTNKKTLFPFDHFFARFQTQKYFMLVFLKTVIFLVTLGLGIGGLNYFVKTDLAHLQKETKQLSQDIAFLKQQNENLFNERNDYLDVRKKLLAQAGYVQTLNRTSWTHVLAAIATELPTELSLTGFKFSENGDVNINGETYDITNIAELIRKVDQSSILEGGKFEFLKEKKEQDAKLFNFGIQANLKGRKDEKDGKK